VEFSSSGRSGSGIDIGGGVALERQLGRLVLLRSTLVPPDRPLRIPDAGPGSGDALIGGKCVAVSWGGDEVETRSRSERLAVDDACFPVIVRARAPGDRIRLPGGTKKLKKLFLEARIPLDARCRVPVVVDAGGDVLWVPGLARVAERAAETRGARGVLRIGID
jgi:tRNA(Ile)-lysidine synthetase-like protein